MNNMLIFCAYCSCLKQNSSRGAIGKGNNKNNANQICHVSSFSTQIFPLLKIDGIKIKINKRKSKMAKMKKKENGEKKKESEN